MVEERFSDYDMLLRSWLSELKRKNQNLSYQLRNYKNSLGVFWSDPTSSSSNPNSVPPDASTSNSIKSALQTLKLYYKDSRILIQYWAPTIIGGRCLLKTSNQPFALSQLDNKLLEYRRGSLDYEFNVDDSEREEDLGLLGRVFRHRLHELTPNVHYYSSKEYPQRQDALRCHIQWSLALPVFELSGQCCVGVLELVTTEAKDFFCSFEDVWLELKEVGLNSFSPYNPFLSKKICDAGHENAIREIYKGLKAVCINHQLPLAQTWVPCGSIPEKSCTCFDLRCGGEVMFTLPYADYISDHYEETFPSCTGSLRLQKGQGVVGRAYISHTSCFCGDVTQFSITDYPLAHWARYFRLTSCFAICLRSTEYTGDFDYVLEFFLPPGKTDGRGDQRTLLNSLLATIKQHFPSFKIASGKELGEELDVQFVDFREVMVVDSFQICQIARSPPMPEHLHNVGDMMQQLSSDPQLMVEDDAIQNERNVVSAEQIETADTYSEKEGTIEIPKTQHRTTEISISFEVLKQHFGRKLEDAAESLSVSRSTLKRICRQHAINRWPSKKRNKKNLSISKQNPPCSHPPPEQAMATIAHTMPHEKAMQGVSTVTIKAEYRDDIIKFLLSSSSTMIELEEKVSHRLKLNVGTFKIKHKDDDDWILISCNEDLEYCITTSRSLGNTTITMLVQPITD